MGLLRFILAISVVIAHSSPIYGFSLVGGQIAVQAFYIISGFYMALILNEKYIGKNDSYTLFITNRFLRLFPIYWTVLLLTVLYSIIVHFCHTDINAECLRYYMDYFRTMNMGSFIFLMFTNLFLFLQDTIMFLGLNTSTGNLFFTPDFRETSPMLYNFLFIPQAWTIGIEIAFYLIAPFLVRKKLKIIIPLVILSIILRFVLSLNGLKDDPWSYRFFPTELAFFLLGIISYRIYKNLNRTNKKTFYSKVIWYGMIIFTLFFNLLPIPHRVFVYMLTFFLGLPFIFQLTKKWKYDTYIGELSYIIYISHMFILTCIQSFKIPVIGGLGISLTVMTILFSILLNESVAKRIEKIRQNRISS